MTVEAPPRLPDPAPAAPRAPAPGRPGISPETAESPALAKSGDALGLLAVAAAFLLPVVYSPQLHHTFWAPRAAICLLLVGPGLVALTHLVRRRSRAALAAALFLVAAAASTAVSGKPVLAVTGVANLGTGLLFVAATVGAWALGVVAGERRRRQIVGALVAAAVVNAAMAWLQGRGLVPVSLESPGRSFGLLGNPVYLGGLSAGAIGALAVVVGRQRRSLAWLAAIVLVAGAAQLSGGRSAVGLSALAVVAGLRGAGARRGLALLAAVAVGFLAAPAWASEGAVLGSTRSVGAEATTQADTRLSFWKMGAEAALERPVLGWGPGRFEAATSPRTTAAASEGGVNVYKDAHNWVVEYLVTTGVVGLVLLLGWLALAARSASGPPAVFAVLIGLFMLVEPQSVSLTPLALLALGASARARGAPVPTGRGWRAATAVGVVAGVGAASLLLTGEFFLQQGRLDTSPAAIGRGAALLPPWADVSRLAGRVESFAGLHSDEHRRLALGLARQGTLREPDDPAAWSYLAKLELVWGTTEGATRAVDRALERNPWYAEALLGSAVLGDRTSDEARIAYACGRLKILGKAPEVCGGPAS